METDLRLVGVPSCTVEACEGAETETGNIIFNFNAEFSLAADSESTVVLQRKFITPPDTVAVIMNEEEESERVVIEMLDLLRVQALRSIIDSVLYAIADFAAVTNNWWHGITATVNIKLLVENLPAPYPHLDANPIHFYFHDQHQYDDHSYDVFQFVPASDHSIRALQRVIVSDSDADCLVCLEDLPAGSAAIQLPCSHTFHGDCIVKWLNTSKFCPLCRFEIGSNHH